MRDLTPTWDGDQPIVRIPLKDAGVSVDASIVAVEIKILDAHAGTVVATRPAVWESRADGVVACYLKGAETDFAGSGGTLLLIPHIYRAAAPDGSAATNVLQNASFDVGSAVATNWTQGGTLGPSVYSVTRDDPAPSVIYGKSQSVYVPTSGSTAFLTQTAVVNSVAGDYVSGGVWLRATLDSGAGLIGEPGYYLRVNDGSDSVKTFFPAGDTDWTFQTATIRTTTNHTNFALQLATYDAIGYSVRFDDAILFRGRWIKYFGEAMRLKVRGRSVPVRLGGSGLVDGFSGFDYDSDGDGVADGLAKVGSGNTYTHERDPDHLWTDGSVGAQKVALAGSTSDSVRMIYRGKFEAGQQWVFRVRYKNAGALSGSPADGSYAVRLSSEQFDGPVETIHTNIGTASNSSYVLKQTPFLTLAGDHNALICEISLNGVTGTAWFDSAVLWRLS